ncbi:MAG: hypothetical protein GXY44_12000 [Phycisphaerales bacterium]|nr:hypothetical protein [Phycisphaerales bacterium]
MGVELDADEGQVRVQRLGAYDGGCPEIDGSAGSGCAVGAASCFFLSVFIALMTIAKERGLSERQIKAIGHVMEHGSMTIQDYQALCPGINRRSLQRDLKALLDNGVLTEAGTSPTDPTKRYTLGERAKP